jgi:hypothetical protein
MFGGGADIMGKRKEGTTRATYSVRLNPDLLRLLKHIAVDENRHVGELLEEGIRAVVRKRKAAAASHAFDHEEIKSEGDGVDIDNDAYDIEIPKFLRKPSDE